MNNPAPREPSMDEILSSIRQIIAEDDAASRKAPGPPSPATVTPLHPDPAPASAERVALEPAPEPLALSVEQIVADDPPEPTQSETESAAVDWAADAQSEASGTSTVVGQGYAGADLVEGEDVSFEVEGEPEPAAPAESAAAPEPPPSPVRPAAPVSRAAPMPDPMLSSDIAEQLLKPATDAAVRHTFARLGNMALANPSLTVEDMMRDMLRPLLKEWLDENLPAVVERMVEREIARISRGIE